MEFIEKFKLNVQLFLKISNYGQPQKIAKKAAAIVKKFDVQPQTPKVTDLDSLLLKIRRLWKKKGFNGLSTLLSRDVKWLPWLLYYGKSPKIVEEKRFLADVLRLLKERWKITLNNLIHVYLKYYDPNITGTELIRKTIHSMLITYDGNNCRLQRWKNRAVLLFAPNGTAITADWLIGRHVDIQTSLEELDLIEDLSNANFLRYASLEIIKKAEKDFPKHLEIIPQLLEIKTFTNNDKLQIRARFPDLIPEAATCLLPKAGVNAEPWIQETLRPFFLRYLYDPRLPGGRTRWSNVSEDAVAVFKQWLSKKDLEFFFNIVEKSSGDAKWMYRRKFWEAYLPYIENTWVALGKRALEIVYTPEMQSHLKERKFSKFSGGEQGQSIFLIEMRGYIFVEWSHGGACRIWQKDNFPLRFGEKKYSAGQIRGKSPDFSIDHRYSEQYRWQDSLAQWLQQNLGIQYNQVKSYYLE
jgi:hypothetical protein